MELQTAEQSKAYFIARQAGILRDLISVSGGTGDKRKELTETQYQTRKNKNANAKKARKSNR